MYKNLYVMLLLAVILFSCKTTQTVTETELVDEPVYPQIEKITDTVFIEKPSYGLESYQAGFDKKVKLFHTKLDISFDWEKEQLIGIANLSFQPYFYEQNQVVIDAQNFDINSVSLIEGKKKQNLQYTYDSLKLIVNLPRNYTADETFEIEIDYVAKPNTIVNDYSFVRGKGLYFIKPDENNPDIIPQIWSKYGTNSAACWFPTIASPNQKMTQDIFVTVDNKYRTISNGVYFNSLLNKDSTRTDHWKLDQPHVPYLTSLIVGDFSKETDYWRKIPLVYNVPPDYEQYAKQIFEDTPEIIEFFSNIFGLDYPWNILNQTIVNKYVGGAMENTTAITYADKILLTPGEMIDEKHEKIIAHEISHQWFGDYVTCKSWPNLAMNESFADYFEYLWIEHKYGKDEADEHLYNSKWNYLNEAEDAPREIIRYYFKDTEDMFDSHTYEKGGQVLHMLRNYIGDKAFFMALNQYLVKHKHGNTDIHDFRIIVEEITGLDMHLFFDQWFLKPGHPVLNIESFYNTDSTQINVKIAQIQEGRSNYQDIPVFYIPFPIKFYTKDTFFIKEVILDEKDESFDFGFKTKIKAIEYDPAKSILTHMYRDYNPEEYVFLYNHTDHFIVKWTALEVLKGFADPRIEQIFEDALNDPFWKIRESAIYAYEFINWQTDEPFIDRMKQMAYDDAHAAVRTAAAYKVAESGDAQTINFLKQLLEDDDAYRVKSSCLYFISTLDPTAGDIIAKKYKNDKALLPTLAPIFAGKNDTELDKWFRNAWFTCKSHEAYTVLAYYTQYLQNFDADFQLEGFNFIHKVLKEDFRKHAKKAGIKHLETLYGSISFEKSGEPETLKMCQQKIDEIKKQIGL